MIILKIISLIIVGLCSFALGIYFAVHVFTDFIVDHPHYCIDRLWNYIQNGKMEFSKSEADYYESHIDWENFDAKMEDEIKSRMEDINIEDILK